MLGHELLNGWHIEFGLRLLTKLSSAGLSRGALTETKPPPCYGERLRSDETRLPEAVVALAGRISVCAAQDHVVGELDLHRP